MVFFESVIEDYASKLGGFYHLASWLLVLGTYGFERQLFGQFAGAGAKAHSNQVARSDKLPSIHLITVIKGVSPQNFNIVFGMPTSHKRGNPPILVLRAVRGSWGNGTPC